MLLGWLCVGNNVKGYLYDDIMLSYCLMNMRILRNIAMTCVVASTVSNMCDEM